MRPKVFIDTNVLIDVLCQDRKSCKVSNKIFQAIKAGLLEGALTPQSAVDASYVNRKDKRLLDKDFRSYIHTLSQYVNIEMVDMFNLRDACTLYNSGDFEDDVLYACAKASCCDIIVTNDHNFKERHQNTDPHIRFMTPEELVEEMTP